MLCDSYVSTLLVASLILFLCILVLFWPGNIKTYRFAHYIDLIVFQRWLQRLLYIPMSKSLNAA